MAQWKIENLQTETVNSVDKVVTWVHYSVYNNLSSGHTTYMFHLMPLDTSAVNGGGSFINFNDLTEATVIGWVKATLGGVKVTEMESEIDLITEASPTDATAYAWEKPSNW